MLSGPALLVSLRRLTFSTLPIVLLIPASLQARAQATAPAVSLGNVAVGSSGTGTVTFTFSATTTVSSVSVVTQGATGLDFQPGMAATGACAAGTYMANATCTVAVKFGPTVPGVRIGAAVLLDGNQNKLASGVVSGIGLGGLAQLPLAAAPGITTPLSLIPYAQAYDGAGNLYTGAQPSGNNPPILTRISPTGTVAQLNPTYPSGDDFICSIAVDPAGTLFLAVGYAGQCSSVLRYDPVTGASSAFAAGTSEPQGVMFDRSGTLYVADDAGIDKVSSAGTVTNFYNQPNSNIYGLAFDPAGNLYFATFDYNRGSTDQSRSIYKIAAGQNTSTLVIQLSTRVYGLAIDAAANIFYHFYNDGVYEIPAGSTTPTLVLSTVSSNDQAIALSGTGMLSYATNSTSITSFNRLGQLVTLPAGTSTPVNGQSAPQIVTVENDGNAPVTFTSFTPAGPAALGMSGYTCAVGTPVPVDSTCTVGVEFAPTAHGSPQTGTVTLAGNTLSPVVSITGYVVGDAVVLSFTPAPPASLFAGGNAGTVKVTVQDNSGATVANSTATITLAVTSSNGYSQSYTSTAVSGIATFDLSGTALTKSGSYIYAASSSGLPTASATESVTPGPASTLILTAINPSPYVGVSDTISITAQDVYGNTATSDNDQTALTSTDSTATLPANFTLSMGTATTTIKFGKGGTFNVTATDATTPPVNGTVSVTVRALPVFTVTTATDDATGIAANCPDQANGGAASSTCSLRDAFAAVTALSNSGTGTYVPTINFATSLYGQTFTMTAASTVNGNVALIGPGAGANAITLSGNNAVTFLSQAAISPVTNLSGLTFSNFRGPQASVLLGSTSGTFTFTNDTFSNNYTPGSNAGGALAINGAITVTGCTFTGNTSAVSGGAISTTQTSVMISNSLFSNNLAASGGAISTSGSGAISIVNTVFLSNKASGGNGGAVFINASTAPLMITNDTFNNNTATTSGGALYTAGLLTISGSSFSANQTGSTGVSYGGAIYISNAAGNSITNTNFIGNKVVTTGTIAYGGALYAARMNLTNVLFSGNSVSASSTADGGGTFYLGNNSSTFTGVTFIGNTTGGGASAQNGGAFYGSSSQLTLYNTTITGNSAKTSGGYFRIGGSLNLYNSVISGNTATGFTNMNTAPTIYSSSYFNVATPCSGSCTPLLSALGSYGGGTVGATGYTTPVHVMLPLPGGPLLAAGSLSYVGAPGTLSGGATTDARGTGYPRTTSYNSSNHVDIGAAEANYTLAFVQQPSTTQLGSTVTPAPTVQLLESGVAGGDGVANDQGSYAGGVLAITATPDAASTASVTTMASGLTSLSETFTAFTPSETLTASVQSGAATAVTVASATSNAFSIGSTKTITFTQPASSAGAGSIATLVAMASNSDPVTFSVTAGTGTASLSGNVITYLTAGTVTINADSAATSTTNAAPTVSYAVTITAAPYVFVAGGGSVGSFNAYGSVASSGVTGGGTGAAVDANGYVWSINSNGTSLSTFTPAGALGSIYTPTGITGATALAIDGNSNIIVTDGNGKLSVVSNAGTTSYTTVGSTTTAPSAVSIDISGNIWVANPGANTVDEFIGGAAPAASLTNAVQNNTTGVKP